VFYADCFGFTEFFLTLLHFKSVHALALLYVRIAIAFPSYLSSNFHLARGDAAIDCCLLLDLVHVFVSC